MRRSVNILGISAFYHDSAACLVQDGKIVSAAQEERFTRKKHDPSFPVNSIKFCLENSNLKVSDLNYVAFYEKPFLKFERIIDSYLAYAPFGINSFLKSVPLWIKQKLWMKHFISEQLSYEGKIIFPEHHESDAASAFFPSPYEEAAILTMDGVGEWTTTSIGIGNKNKIDLLYEMKFPHSLGLFYSAFTYYTGFKVNSGEYKVMGLAPYGEPRYKDLILKELIDLKEDGSFRLNMKYFDYCTGLKMTNEKFHRLFGGSPRKSESKLTQRDMDLAKSIQEVTEDIMLKMAKHAYRVTGKENLCLSGGVALNCVGNGKILSEGLFKNIWIQPASGDAGSALGAALFTWYQYLGNERNADEKKDFQAGSYLGPRFTRDKVLSYLIENEISYVELKEEEMPEKVADLLAEEKVIGWFHGRMEFGPRALGARSIIGDARSSKMQEQMNLKIKFRESFRPFAPSVLKEKSHEYFHLSTESPYMLLTAPIKKEIRTKESNGHDKLFGIEKLKVVRSKIPAVTHVDFSARVQTVNSEDNPAYYKLISKFNEKYGCAVIVNTSFNVRGEPIVCTPGEAYMCFMRTKMDYLLIENFLLKKEDQKPLNKDFNWQKEFELD